LASDPSHRRSVRRAKRAGRALLFLIVVAAILAAAVPTHGQTPGGGWTQVQGGPTHAGVADAGPDAPYREAWRLEQALSGPAAQYGLSSPIAVGDVAVTVAPRAVVAVDLSDGSPAWTVGRAFGPSVAPAAAAAGDRTLVLYTEGFGSGPPTSSPSPSPAGATGGDAEGPDEDEESFLVAIDAQTQDPAWDAPVPLEAVSRTGVTIEGDTALVGDRSGTVYAVDVATGELRWSEPAGGPISVPVTVADGTVVAMVEGDSSTRATIVALDLATGERRWAHEVAGAAVFGSGTSVTQGRIVAGFSDQTIRSFDLDTGDERWSSRVNALAFVSTPVQVGDAVVAVDSAGQVFRFDAADGERAWDFALNQLVVRSSAVVIGDRVLVATTDGDLVAIDLASGLLVWRRGASGAVLRGLTPADDRVVAVVGGRHAGLVAFEHDPDGALVSEVSPTEADPGALALAYVAAAVPLGVVLLLGGRWLRRRLGPAFLEGDDPTDVGAGGGLDPDGDA
jgi:outer membrane protein assembly factor BamB